MSGISRDAATCSSPSLPRQTQTPFDDPDVVALPPNPTRSRSPARRESRARPHGRPRSIIGSVLANNKWSTKFSREGGWRDTTFTSSLVSKEEQPDRAAAPHGRDSHEDTTDTFSPFLDIDRKYTLCTAQTDVRHRSKSHWVVATTRLLILGQIACTVVLRGYDLCGRTRTEGHITASTTQNEKAVISRWSTTGTASIDECDAFIKSLPFHLPSLERVSPELFVSAALMWAALAMSQYQINRRDRFQKLGVWIGLLVGLFICDSSFRASGKPLVISSLLSFNVTTAMFCSEIGHWLYEMIFASKRGDTRWSEEIIAAEVNSEDV